MTLDAMRPEPPDHCSNTLAFWQVFMDLKQEQDTLIARWRGFIERQEAEDKIRQERVLARLRAETSEARLQFLQQFG